MRNCCARSCAVLLFALALPVALVQADSAAGRRPITHEDLWLMQRIGALEASPDGRWFVASVAEPAYDEDRKRSDHWIMASDGSSAP
jgi:hypothetical protein